MFKNDYQKVFQDRRRVQAGGVVGDAIDVQDIAVAKINCGAVAVKTAIDGQHIRA